MGRSLRRCRRTILICAALALGAGTSTAEEIFRTAPVEFMRADWRAALDQLSAEMAARPETANYLSFAGRRHASRSGRRHVAAITQLNAITSPLFPAIARSPVPVLLPFDVSAYLAERIGGAPESLTPARYQSDFRAVDFFHAGPAGYDAVFSMEPGATSELPSRVFSKPVEVHITGSILTHTVGTLAPAREESVKTLNGQYPDLRRLIREGFVRYAFTRFGVAYVVSINCLDSAPRSRRLACREAYPVAERFLKALRVNGGTPAAHRANIASFEIARPAEFSADFTYVQPGLIVAGTGYRGKGGIADRHVYAQIRFPLAQAPAYANSQLYRGKRSCTSSEGEKETKNSSNPKPAGEPEARECAETGFVRNRNEAAVENYSYPWRDNYCERRDFEVGLCPSGMGHQGQDLRPSTCVQRNAGPGGCQPLQHAVLAVRDGLLIRARRQQTAYLVVNERNEHLRFRYVHMNPDRMDADGAVSGRSVAEGEEFGQVANYQDRAGGTTTHLHFDVQAFTRDGWIWVNPYVTLIAAYERMIGARGRELAAPPGPSPAGSPAPPVSGPLAEPLANHADGTRDGEEGSGN
jgi:hypothetical protein